MRRVGTSALLSALLVAVPAGAGTIDTETSGPVSAYGGRVVWSKKDPATGRYRLRTLEGGVVRDVPIAPRRHEPFDVDLGPGPDGRPVAVYSRCARVDRTLTQDTPRGDVVHEERCDLYLYEFSGRERRLGFAGGGLTSEYNPSVWRDRIVFARRSDTGLGERRLHAGLYAVDTAGRTAVRRIRGGPRGVSQRQSGLGLQGGPGPLRIDLRGNTAAVSWYFHAADDADYAQSLILLTTLGGRVTEVDGTDEGWVDSPVFGGPRVFYLEEYLEGANPSYDSLNRYDRRSRRIRSVPLRAGSVALTEGRFYVSSDSSIEERTFAFP